jgi:hypothetical protein
MVLKQAEEEGYSVFVIRQAGEGWGDAGVGELAVSAADALALELGEVSDRSGAQDGYDDRRPRYGTNNFPSLQAGRESPRAWYNLLQPLARLRSVIPSPHREQGVAAAVGDRRT